MSLSPIPPQKQAVALSSRTIGQIVADKRSASQFLELDRWLGDFQDASFLELGCGTGSLLHSLLSSRGGAVAAGIEPKQAELLLACERNRAAVQALRCQVLGAVPSDLPFADAYFDVVYSVNDFHTWERRREAVREIRRVIKPGGVLVLGIRIKGETWLTCGGEDCRVAQELCQWLLQDGWTISTTERIACSAISDEYWVRAVRRWS